MRGASRPPASSPSPTGPAWRCAPNTRPTTTISSVSPASIPTATSSTPDGGPPVALTDIRVWGITATLNHLLTDHLMVRGEVRWDDDRQARYRRRRVLASTTTEYVPQRPGRDRRRGHLQLQRVRRRVASSGPSRDSRGVVSEGSRAPSAFAARNPAPTRPGGAGGRRQAASSPTDARPVRRCARAASLEIVDHFAAGGVAQRAAPDRALEDHLGAGDGQARACSGGGSAAAKLEALGPDHQQRRTRPLRSDGRQSTLPRDARPGRLTSARPFAASLDRHGNQVRAADEARDERRRGRVVDLLGRADLLEPARCASPRCGRTS